MPDHNSVRIGVNQAHENYRNSNILIGEIFIIAIALGLHYQSWWILGGVLFGFFVAMRIPYLGSGILFLLSLFWGITGWNLGGVFESLGAQIVLGFMALSAGLFIHFSGRQWFKDQERNG